MLSHAMSIAEAIREEENKMIVSVVVFMVILHL